MSKKRMKRRMKRRRTVTILSLIVILVTAMLNLVWAKEKDTVTVVVKSGDTVWSIAGENNPGNKDLRKLNLFQINSDTRKLIKGFGIDYAVTNNL